MTKNSKKYISDIIIKWLEALPFPSIVMSKPTDASQYTVDFCNEKMQDFIEGSGTDLDRVSPSFFLDQSEGGNADAIKSVEEMEAGVYYTSSVNDPQSINVHMLRSVRLTAPGADAFCCVLTTGIEVASDEMPKIMDALTCYVVEFDKRGNIRYVNDTLLAHLGYKLGEDAPPDHLSRLQDGFKAEMLDKLDTSPESGATIRNTFFLRKDGTKVAMETSIIANHLVPKGRFLLTARDLTEENIREAKFNKALNSTYDHNKRLEDENARMRLELDGGRTNLVYRSKKFEKIVDQIRSVAPLDTPVLITGETGTGKEVIARTIHELSKRSKGAMVTVDCSSIPEQLIESELFGYRKGAFTGANKDHKGRFAMADGGTIFLDEIGEMPLHLQSRLLRVIQDGKFTPIGQNNHSAADFRVIAATNRDLAAWVKQGKFRSDLYYRLNVFNIKSIPLRERPEDIIALLEFYIERFNRRHGKNIKGVEEKMLEKLLRYSFPGNVRELQNMVERAFVLASGDSLPIQLPTMANAPLDTPLLDVHDGELTEFLSIEEHQRRYIEMVLKATDGKVSGANGAAEILQINPQTLFSRMKKLGIKR